MSKQPVFQFDARFTPENLQALLDWNPNPQHFKRNVGHWLDRLKNPISPSLANQGGDPGYVRNLRALAAKEALEAHFAKTALELEEARVDAMSPEELSAEAARVAALSPEEIAAEIKARLAAVKAEASRLKPGVEPPTPDPAFDPLARTPFPANLGRPPVY